MNKLTIKELLEDCNSNDPSRQTPAIMELQKREAHEAVPTLLNLLSSPEENIRMLSAEALGYVGSDEVDIVGPAITKLLFDPEYLIRSYAIEALTALDYKPAIESAKFLCVNDSEWLVRISAIEALADLANIGDFEVLALLSTVFENQEEDELIAGYAAWAMGVLGTTEFLPKIQEYLKSEESIQVKANLLMASYRLGIQSDLEVFLDLLKNADEEMARIFLNHLQELTERRTPLSLANDAEYICEVVSEIGKSFPIELNHAEQVISQFKEIEIQNILLQ
jgi:HEAT repeat protein